MTKNPYRELPAVEHLLSDQRVLPLITRHGHAAVLEMARELLDEYRMRISREGYAPAQEAVEALLARATQLEPTLRPVINATGVILHTNLGRAPLSNATLDAMSKIGRGYSTLEFDLATGVRGSRFVHLAPLLRRVTGAEDGIAVNNNAGALLLALAALTAEREVIISRGELIEIGGGFRIPDVLRQSGTKLVEVGTTNRTYDRDYAQAITAHTAAILRVHPSNFRMVGFTEQPSLEALTELAHEHDLLLFDDLGSGSLIETKRYGLPEEPTVQQSIVAGADLVFFSGDKLVGGPQAGIVVGGMGSIAALRRHPLARALRMDKASLAGLAATLEHYAKGEAESSVPVWRMIAQPTEEIRIRARSWASAAGHWGTVTEGRSMIGGGSLPEESVPTVLCALDAAGGAGNGGADQLAHALRTTNPPVITRIEDGRVLLDPRTVDPVDDRAVAIIIESVCTRLLEQAVDAKKLRVASEVDTTEVAPPIKSISLHTTETTPASSPLHIPPHSSPSAPMPNSPSLPSSSRKGSTGSPSDSTGPFFGGNPPGR